MKKNVRRWRYFACFMGQHRQRKTDHLIEAITRKGFKAKIWSPLPEHKTSGHIHIVVLCTLEEKCKLAGI